MKITALVKQFSLHLERLGYSKNSIYMLPNCLKEFLEWKNDGNQNSGLNINNGRQSSVVSGQNSGQLSVDCGQITQSDILNFYQYLQTRPHKRKAGALSESYIHHHIYSLKLFFGWQQEKGAITENPISSLEFKTPVSPSREILTKEEIKLLFEACQTLKERAVLALFYGCGLRRSEGEKLDLKDVHFRTGILYVREGKGSKRRAVPMSKKVSVDLKNYVLKERFSVENQTALICNERGKRTSGNSYNNILKKLLERLGSNNNGGLRSVVSGQNSGLRSVDCGLNSGLKSISLHSLRHSIATHLLESGLSVEYVRDFLGHQHIETTQIYTRVKNQQIWNLNST